MRKNKQYIFYTTIYVLVIVYITCLSRTMTFISQHAPYPFWSYVKLINGEWQIGVQIVENIVLFIPLGYWLYTMGLRKSTVVITGLVLSGAIECCQYFFHLGLFEFDDIINNTIGAFLGTVIGKHLLLSDRRKMIYSVVIIFFSCVYCIWIPQTKNENPEQLFYFGIEKSGMEDNKIVLSGYCFAYEKPDANFKLFIQSEKGIIEFSSTCKLSQEKIDDYFKCSEDYSNAGFVASAPIKMDTDYEIFVKWDNDVTMSTGVYIVNGEISYTANKAPSFPGTLLVSRPEYDFYVYQKDGELYWLCGENFPFEDDGRTYIQYQLWTTQPELLPEERLLHEWFWDNIGFDFEEYEIDGIDGYRVAKRMIPTEYSITVIETGYFNDRKWIWKDFFRPVLFELPIYQNL